MTNKMEVYASKILDGQGKDKTRGQMLRESGYSESVAKNPRYVEQSQKFQQILLTACPDNLLKQKLLEALEFTKPVINNAGQIVSEIPDNSNRLRALEVVLKLRNLFPKDIAESNANNLSAWLNGIKLQKELNKPT